MSQFDNFLQAHEVFAHTLNSSHICDWPETTTKTSTPESKPKSAAPSRSKKTEKPEVEENSANQETEPDTEVTK